MRIKMYFVSLAIVTAVLILYAVLSTGVYYDNSVAHSREYLKVYMNAYDPALYPPTYEGSEKFSASLDGARVTFLDEKGYVVADSEEVFVGTYHADRAEVVSAAQSGSGFAVRSSDSIGQDLIYYCVKTESGFVRIAIPTSSQWSVFGDSMILVLWLLAIDIIACIVLTYIGTENVIAPVKEIARDATLNKRVSSKYKELQPIVEILNERNDELAAQFREIREEKELVEKAQKSKNEFISNITHEMNTPLTSIKGYTELLASGMLDEAQTQVAYATVERQTERLTNLISCIIHYNEIDNDDLPSYELDAGKILHETILSLRPAIDEKSLTLVEEIDADVQLNSRYERVEQIFGNLIRNAIRYNYEEGRLYIALKKGEEGKADLVVEDTGIGIEEKNIERIFDRFYTVDRSHSGKNGGFGLGLAVVKKICQRSDWQILVESEPGKGTRFTVKFHQ